MKPTLTVTPLEDRCTPATLVVSSLSDDVAADNFLTLREAIALTNHLGSSNEALGRPLTTGESAQVSGPFGSNDTITFGGFEDVTTGYLYARLNGVRLEVTRSVKIVGPKQPGLRIGISGNDLSQVFCFNGRINGPFTASISNLIVAGGKSSSVFPNIDSLNSGDYGAGILNIDCDLTLDAVEVAHCRSIRNGGGIFNWQGANSKLTLLNSAVFNNRADEWAGGVYTWLGSTFVSINSTVSYNSANLFGGGIVNNGGQTTLTNVTIVNNRADSDTNGTGNGGGLLTNVLGTVHLHNSIVSNNSAGNLVGMDDVQGTLSAASSFNIVANAATAGGLVDGNNGNQLGINPWLEEPARNGGFAFTHALQQNSPALGKGSIHVPNFQVYDQRGTSRDNGTPDIGAYEVNHPLATVGAPTTLAGLYSPKPSASANEAFVKGLYQSTLLRAPDAAGLAGWVAQLNSGTSRGTVANGFVNSVENRRNQVTFFYRYFLYRDPDTAGLNGWVNTLRSGTDEGQVMTGFILSNEFSGLNNNSQFVNLMYYALLSRQAETAGFNHWLNLLNGGTSRATVVNAFLRSEEGLNRVIQSQFQTYLKRYATSGDLSAFRAYLQTSTFGQAAISILAGAEFYNNAGNNLS